MDTQNGTRNIFNASDLDQELLEKYDKNRSVSELAYWVILVSYSFLIVLGSLGNLLVILAVINNKGKTKSIFFFFKIRQFKVL